MSLAAVMRARRKQLVRRKIYEEQKRLERKRVSEQNDVLDAVTDGMEVALIVSELFDSGDDGGSAFIGGGGDFGGGGADGGW